MSDQASEMTTAEIRQLFRETAEGFQEIKVGFQEIEARFKETDARFKETDARLDQRFRESDENLRRLEGLFGNQWGRLIEALVQPGVLTLFQKRGVGVRRLYSRAKSQLNGDTMEIDMIMEDDQVVVAGEVKSAMGVGDVREFIADLGRFTHFFPRYNGYHIFGAVAALEFVEGADRFAYRQGLFALGVQGQEMVVMLNDEKFRPHDFAADQLE
jgi:hypothetical protein